MRELTVAAITAALTVIIAALAVIAERRAHRRFVEYVDEVERETAQLRRASGSAADQLHAPRAERLPADERYDGDGRPTFILAPLDVEEGES